MTAPVPEPSVKVRVVCLNHTNMIGGKLGLCAECGKAAAGLRGTYERDLAPGESSRLLASALAGLVEEFDGLASSSPPSLGAMRQIQRDKCWWRDKLAALSGPLHQWEEGTK